MHSIKFARYIYIFFRYFDWEKCITTHRIRSQFSSLYIFRNHVKYQHIQIKIFLSKVQIRFGKIFMCAWFPKLSENLSKSFRVVSCQILDIPTQHFLSSEKQILFLLKSIKWLSQRVLTEIWGWMKAFVD